MIKMYGLSTCLFATSVLMNWEEKLKNEPHIHTEIHLQKSYRLLNIVEDFNQR